jgi:hypothetical protein
MERKDFIYFLTVGLCLAFIVGLLFFMSSQTAQCVKNPFIYGASHMGNVECSCIQFNNPTCPAQFSFNDTSFIADPKVCGGTGSLYHRIDLNNLNISK